MVITCYFVQYWPRFSNFTITAHFLNAYEISCNISETQKIFPILHLAPCNNNIYYKVNTLIFLITKMSLFLGLQWRLLPGSERIKHFPRADCCY